MVGIRDDVLFQPEQNTDVLVAELCEVEMGDPVGVGEEVDFGDLAVLDRESGDRERSPV
jgi:hypothetical protein